VVGFGIGYGVPIGYRCT